MTAGCASAMQMTLSGKNCLLRRKREGIPTRYLHSTLTLSFSLFMFLLFYFSPYIFFVCLLLLTEHGQLEYQMAAPTLGLSSLANPAQWLRARKICGKWNTLLDPAALQFEPVSSFVACANRHFSQPSLFLSLPFVAPFHVFPYKVGAGAGEAASASDVFEI